MRLRKVPSNTAPNVLSKLGMCRSDRGSSSKTEGAALGDGETRGKESTSDIMAKATKPWMRAKRKGTRNSNRASGDAGGVG